MKSLFVCLLLLFISVSLNSEQLFKMNNGTTLEGIVVEETDSTCKLSTEHGILKLSNSEIAERIDLYVEIKMQNGDEFTGIVVEENDSILKLKEDGEEPVTLKKSDIVSREILPDLLSPIITLPSKKFAKRHNSSFLFPFGKPSFYKPKYIFLGGSLGWPCLINVFAGVDFYKFQLRGSLGFFSAQLHLNYYIIQNDKFKWALGPGVGGIIISPGNSVYYILSTNIRWYDFIFEVGAFKFDREREVYPFPYFQIGFSL
jgi:hypothetical protein